MTRSIIQQVVIEASAEDIYNVLTNAEEFSKMSGGAPAEITASVGSAYSLFGGMITGIIVECVPGERLVQVWRAGSWDAGIYSIVRFDLESVDDGTKISLDHSGFPEGQDSHLDAGWQENYWKPLTALLS